MKIYRRRTGSQRRMKPLVVDPELVLHQITDYGEIVWLYDGVWYTAEFENAGEIKKLMSVIHTAFNQFKDQSDG